MPACYVAASETAKDGSGSARHTHYDQVAKLTEWLRNDPDVIERMNRVRELRPYVMFALAAVVIALVYLAFRPCAESSPAAAFLTTKFRYQVTFGSARYCGSGSI